MSTIQLKDPSGKIFTFHNSSGSIEFVASDIYSAREPAIRHSDDFIWRVIKLSLTDKLGQDAANSLIASWTDNPPTEEQWKAIFRDEPVVSGCYLEIMVSGNRFYSIHDDGVYTLKHTGTGCFGLYDKEGPICKRVLKAFITVSGKVFAFQEGMVIKIKF